MKSFKMLMMAALTILSVSVFAQKATGKKVTSSPSVKVLYSCPMHPEITSNKPGKCSKCGMDLVKHDTKMATYSCPMHADVTSDKPGKCSKCGMDLTKTKKEQMKMEVMKMYSCPMHSDVTSDKPGKCPKCGMTLKEKE